MRRAEPEQLLEREDEVTALRAALEAARRGSGRLVLLEGPAGIGKTRLLAEVRALAREGDMLVASGRGSELEQGFPFGVVRQLLEPILAGAGAGERARLLSGAAQLAAPLFEPEVHGAAGADGELGYPRLHGLYWLCANLAREQPVLLAVDDVQWADEASLSFLGFLARRIEDLPVLLAVALRPERRAEGLVELLADPLAEVVRPFGLSLAAVADWIREIASTEADPAFAEACHAATGGNPLLMRELLQEILAEGLEITAENAERVRSLGPRGVSTVVLLRVARLPGRALEIARGAALLGDGAHLDDAAALVGVSLEEARAAAGALVAAHMLEDAETLTFVHPIVRASILDDMPFLERARGHGRAAEHLRKRGASAEEVAVHLLVGQPEAPGAWVSQTLREAAAHARTLGDPAAAASHLRRALELGVAEDERAEILADLGYAEALAGQPDAPAHLRAAIRLGGDLDRRVRWMQVLGDVLKFAGEATAAADVLTLLDDEIDPGSEHAELLQVELAGTGFISIQGRRRVGDRVRSLRLPSGLPATHTERLALAAAAFESAAVLNDAARAVDYARRALAGRGPRGEHLLADQRYVLATAALTFCEELDEVERYHAETLETARREGSARGVATASSMRSFSRWRMGRVRASEADALAALELSAFVHGAATLGTLALAHGIHAAVERCAGDEAVAALESTLELDSDLMPYVVVFHARGVFHAAAGRLEEALAAFGECDRDVPGWGRDCPALIPWRSSAALVLLAKGENAEAARLAAEELALAQQIGTPRVMGVALRAVALTGPPDRRRERLEETVDRLARSHDRLEHARALIDLGAELRRGGERRAARRPLEEGLRMADRSGSEREAQRAREELAATGAKVPRGPAAGVASLTPSERRVAELAADGRTNREIAQALFLSEKTVETHLSHVYGKLDIPSRRDLPAALDAGDSH